jgi:DNA repair exonuclease SbcCD ATPase subunit
MEIEEEGSEIERLRRRIAELEAELAKWEEREGAVCPEDVGFDEYIKVLMKANTGLYDTANQLEADNSRLRECLKRLEWLPDETWATETCYACGFSRPTHNDGCWLAAELKENQ